MAPPRKPDKDTARAAAKPDASPEDLLRDCDERERRYLRSVLSGKSHTESLAYGGWRGPMALQRVLGRPHVVRALEALAPLALSDADALQALRPLLRMRLYQACQGKQALGAIRDFLALVAPGAGSGGEASSREKAWQEAQKRRAAVTGPEGGPG